MLHKKGKAELAGYEPRYFQLRRDRLRTLEWYDAGVSPGELPPREPLRRREALRGVVSSCEAVGAATISSADVSCLRRPYAN